jgi:hypothetical protein
MKLLEMFKRMLPTAEDRSFKSSVSREAVVLITMMFVDIITSVIMMRIHGAQLEGNTSFRELYLNPTLQNAFNFINGQLVYVIPIVIGIILAGLSSTSIVQIESIKPFIQFLSYCDHLFLILFAFLRLYGTYTNIAGISIDLPSGLTLAILVITLVEGSLLILVFDEKCRV